MHKLLLTLFCIFVLYNFGKSQAKFNIPESVCVGQSFMIENVSTGGSTFYWNFCSGSLGDTPMGENLGNIWNLNRPVYSSIIKDGANYYVFITNLTGGSISRLDFGNSLSNMPSAVNLGNLGVLSRNEGIQIKKDNASGKWYGLVAGFDQNYIARINFGTNLQNNAPTAENLGNIGNLMEGAHTLYTFEENNNWYTIVGNNTTNRLTRLNFGTSLANTPSATDMGNIGALSGPVGFYPVLESGNWYMFVANQKNNTISRLDFGNSLTNQPTGVNLGNIGTKLNAPRSIIIIRDCGTVFGFVVNGSPDADSANDLVRITFPGGLTSPPSGVSLGNIAGFSFPHHISQLFREGDSVYSLVTNVNNNTLSRFTFKGCTNPSIPSSILKDPLSIRYDVPGTYNIRLIIDEGLPGESIYCKQITVGNPLISFDPVTPEICEGSSVTLKAVGATTYLWSPSTGLSSTSDAEVKASPSATTTYTVTGKNLAGCSENSTILVTVNPKPTITGIASKCEPDMKTYLTGFISSGDQVTAKYGHVTGQNSLYTITNIPGKTSNTIVSTISLTECSDSVVVSSPSCESSKIRIPEGFSPNNDGENDFFEISGIEEHPESELTVFNRAGQTVYSSKNYGNDWDGSYYDTNNVKNGPLPKGAYYYVLKLDGKTRIIKGFVYIAY